MQNRIHKLINTAISITNLDLSGLTILTEVGSNNYLFTPIIAALANAQKVFAWTKDSDFGKGEQVVEECKSLMQELGIPIEKIIFRINERPNGDISKADIITNLGMVRPISAEFIKIMKANAVIPYMCEAWELRDSDVDINACKSAGIKIAGTWENHPDLMIFDGCGALSIKLVQEAGFEVYQNKICIISDDHFGEVAYKAFQNLGAEVNLVLSSGIDQINFEKYDLIFLANYKSDDVYLGEHGRLNKSKLPIVHLIGNVSYKYAVSNKYFIYPPKDGFSMRMTKTLADLGPKPVIDLHTAGFKVGEDLFKNKNNEYMQKIN